MLTAALLALGLLAIVFAIEAAGRVQAKRARHRALVAVEPIASLDRSPSMGTAATERALAAEVEPVLAEPSSLSASTPILCEPWDAIEELGVDSGFM